MGRKYLGGGALRWRPYPPAAWPARWFCGDAPLFGHGHEQKKTTGGVRWADLGEAQWGHVLSLPFLLLGFLFIILFSFNSLHLHLNKPPNDFAKMWSWTKQILGNIEHCHKKSGT